jgi:hypothetical protein
LRSWLQFLMAFVGGTRKATRVKSLRTLPDASPVRSQKLSKSEPRLVVPTETLTAVQSSELARHMDPSHLQAMVDQISKQLEEEGKGLFTFKTIPQGAATSVWAGVVASADEIGGSGMAIPTVLKTNSTKLLEVLASSSRESLGGESILSSPPGGRPSPIPLPMGAYPGRSSERVPNLPPSA